MFGALRGVVALSRSARNVILVAGAVALALAAASPANAACVADIRKVVLDKAAVPLKSYRCSTGTGADAAQVRVEVHRFSDLAASLTIANASSSLLQKTFGKMKVVENDVSRTFAGLLKQFGTTYEVAKEQAEMVTTLSVNVPDQQSATDDTPNYRVDDTVPPKKAMKFQASDDSPDYPAADEIAALRKKQIPANLNYYYWVNDSFFCADTKNLVCKAIDKDHFAEMVFWRSMQPDDIANYAGKAKAYNAQLMQVRKNRAAAKNDLISANLDFKYYALMKQIGGDYWPEDLVIMTGRHQMDACGTDADMPGVAGWSFSAPMRKVVLDAMVIENASPKPVAIGALFGSKITENTLRAIGTDSSPGADSIGVVSETLAPGQRLFVPMRIAFLAPADLAGNIKTSEKSAADTSKRFGSNGFTGRADAMRLPSLKDYAYGPTLSIGAIEVNATRVDLESRIGTNFIDLTVTSEVGSCPYLLSQEESSQDWISHGKILHRALGRDHRYTEARTFPGLRTHFRLEEREPEIATIEDISLIVTRQDGTAATLRPRPVGTASVLSGRFELLWGDGVEFEFVPPENAASGAIVESRLEVTGYYLRYSGLDADGMAALPSQPPQRLQTRISFVPTAAGRMACFRPIR
jgi:hypothetical protein